MKMPLRWAIFGFVFCLSLPAVAASGEDALMRAMRDELARTVAELRMEDLEAPYFVSYTVRDTERMGTQASFGALLPSLARRTRRLTVEVRVGDSSFDNTNFLSLSLWDRFSPTTALLPLEDDMVELRRQIWLATDTAYKKALESLAAKRAAFKSQTASEELGDLSPAEPYVYIEEPDRRLPPLTEVQSLVRRLSGLFTGMPHVMESGARAAVRYRRTYYVNSEGSSFIRNDPAAYLNVVAHTQAPDGSVLSDFLTAFGASWDEIAGQEDLTARVTAKGQRLAARRSAASIDNYIGPVLFEGQAAAELVAQLLAPRMVGTRAPFKDLPPGVSVSTGETENPFTDKLGARVMARGLSVRDDATLRSDGYLGGYAVDDEAISAGSTSLVENGVLKTLLTTRNPVRGVNASTGNRRGRRAAPSNLLVTSRRGLSREEMLAELMLLVEERQAEFGVVIRRLGNPGYRPPPVSGSNASGSKSGVDDATLAYKVYRDGREELMQAAEFSGIADSMFKEIVAASDSSTLYTFIYPSPGSGFQSGIPDFWGNFVSVSVPDLLFDELTLRKPSGNMPRPPVAGHPFFTD